jgi:hypothetical protein
MQIFSYALESLQIRAAPLFLKCPFQIPFCFARGEYYLNEEKGILRGGAARQKTKTKNENYNCASVIPTLWASLKDSPSAFASGISARATRAYFS